MPLRTFFILRGHLTSLAVTLCLLPAMSKAANLVGIAEVQSKAEQGFVTQELELAADYLVGRGVPKDLTQSAYWYRKAADQGNPAAQVYLGYMYTVGIGVSQARAEAVEWY